ncbi:MAG: alpha-glucosidase/alpha-galactosidase [Lachnospiraceae bacterium]|nr:alpha-glucosidase/alpha-galactosidase [Lachnospiraceae bacterium]
MNPKRLNIAYIGGGSRQWAWTFMTDLALEADLGGTIRLYDIDTAAAKNNDLIGNRMSNLPSTKGKWFYDTYLSLEEAVTGADFVIISIMPGTFEHMYSDVHTPERLGIYQSVGDTTGPGGIIRSLRTIPAFVKFAAAIRDFAPEAWVINYTNPMSICLRTLYHVFPEIKAFGCCHEVFGMQNLLALMATRNLGIEVLRKEIKINVLGLNHFTWFDSAAFGLVDLMEMYRDFVDEFYETGFETDISKLPHRCFSSNNRVKFDLFRRYGLIAAAGDRHLAEFMPKDNYLKDPQSIEKWGFYLTSVNWRIEDLARRKAKSERLVSREEALDITPSGEEGVLLIKALCGLGDVKSNVNLPNTANQIDNFPAETVVETNAIFSRNNIRPLNSGKLPETVFALTEPHIINQTEVLNAGLNFDREAVYRAFRRDPLTCHLAEADLKGLADEMIRKGSMD